MKKNSRLAKSEARYFGVDKTSANRLAKALVLNKSPTQWPPEGPRRPRRVTTEGGWIMRRRHEAPRSGPRRAPGGSVQRSRKWGVARLLATLSRSEVRLVGVCVLARASCPTKNCSALARNKSLGSQDGIQFCIASIPSRTFAW